MAQRAPKEPPKDNGGEYKRPDAAGAFKIFDQEIKAKQAHLSTIRGDLSDPYSRIKDSCNFPRKVLDFIISLENMEDAKRDHNLLALSEGLKHRKLFLPRDLVTMARGDADTSIVGSGERPKPQLVTVPSDGDDSDLAEAGGAEKADPEALVDPAYGTGAAAIRDMKAATGAEKAQEDDPAQEAAE